MPYLKTEAMKMTLLRMLTLAASLFSRLDAGPITLTGPNGRIVSASGGEFVDGNAPMLIDGDLSHASERPLFSNMIPNRVTLVFDQDYDIDRFIFWNGWGIEDNEVGGFWLEFFDSSDVLMARVSGTSPDSVTRAGYTFPAIRRTRRVDFIVTDLANVKTTIYGPELREINFEGAIANAIPRPANFIGSVARTAAVDTTITTLVANDPNAEDTHQWEILSGDSENLFDLDAATGRISVRDAAALYRCRTNAFQLRVKVTDNGIPALSAEQRVLIYLTGLIKADITVSPLIQNYTRSDKEVYVTTVPYGLPVRLFYSGGSTRPTEVGDYPIRVEIADPLFTGSFDGTLKILPYVP